MIIVTLALLSLAFGLRVNWRCGPTSVAEPSDFVRIRIMDINGAPFGPYADTKCDQGSVVINAAYPKGIYFARFIAAGGDLEFDSQMFTVGYSGESDVLPVIKVPERRVIQQNSVNPPASFNQRQLPPPKFEIQLESTTGVLNFNIPCNSDIGLMHYPDYRMYFSAEIYNDHVRLPLGGSYSSCKDRKFQLDISSSLKTLEHGCYKIMGTLISGSRYAPSTSPCIKYHKSQ